MRARMRPRGKKEVSRHATKRAHARARSLTRRGARAFLLRQGHGFRSFKEMKVRSGEMSARLLYIPCACVRVLFARAVRFVLMPVSSPMYISGSFL